LLVAALAHWLWLLLPALLKDVPGGFGVVVVAVLDSCQWLN